MRLTDVPAGTTLFIDANCFLYHFTGTYLSCALLLERAARRDIHAVTSAAVVAEVHHRLMVSEVVQRLNRPARNIPRFLKRHPDIIRSLTQSQHAFNQLRVFRLRVLPVTRRSIFEAQRIARELGLLTNDALIIATMRAHRLTHLASNDSDFIRVPAITLWRP